jgi:hypothetical protein
MDSVRRMLAALFKDGFKLPVVNHEEDESNGSGAIVDHPAQPTAPPPITSEPVVEPECADEWDFDTLLDHAAPPPTTSEPVFGRTALSGVSII